jgi:hypothetical protein
VHGALRTEKHGAAVAVRPPPKGSLARLTDAPGSLPQSTCADPLSSQDLTGHVTLPAGMGLTLRCPIHQGTRPCTWRLRQDTSQWWLRCSR